MGSKAKVLEGHRRVFNQVRQLSVWGLALLEEWGAEAGRAGRGELGQPEGALGVKRN